MDNTGEVIALIKGLSRGGGSGGGGISVTGAKKGQLVRAKAVDATGNITEWEPVPFMYEATDITEIFPVQEVTGFTELDPGLYTSQQNLGIVQIYSKMLSGEIPKSSFIITWDGINYSCPFSPSLGNEHIVDPEAPDTGEPFYVAIDRNGEIYATASAETSHMIGAGYGATTVEKIPMKFLPESSPTVRIIENDNFETWTEEFWSECYADWIKGIPIIIHYQPHRKRPMYCPVLSLDNWKQDSGNPSNNRISFMYACYILISYNSKKQTISETYISRSEYMDSALEAMSDGVTDSSGVNGVRSILLENNDEATPKYYRLVVDNTGALKVTDVTAEISASNSGGN